MKMFIIMYEYAIDAEVIAVIEKTGITGYTKWSKVQGAGPECGPKLDTRFWPGENDVMLVVVDDKDAVKVKEMVLNLRKAYPKSGVRCFIVPVEEMI
jgi:nitrogen regulatory protein PII